MRQDQSIYKKVIVTVIGLVVCLISAGSICYISLICTSYLWNLLPLKRPFSLMPQNKQAYVVTMSNGEIIRRRMIVPIIDKAIKFVTKRPHKVFPFVGSIIVSAFPIFKPVGNVFNAVGRFLHIIPRQNNTENPSIGSIEDIELQADSMTSSTHTIEDLPLVMQNTEDGAYSFEYSNKDSGSLIEKIIRKSTPRQIDNQNFIAFVLLFMMVLITIIRIVRSITGKFVDNVILPEEIEKRKLTTTILAKETKKASKDNQK